MTADMNNAISDKKLNFRDLGGTVTSDGRKLRYGVLLRSAKLSKLKPSDSRALTDFYKLKYVIDVRSDIEKDGREDIIPAGAEYVEIPVFNENTLSITSGMGADVFAAVKQAKSKRELLNYIPELTDVYPLMVTDEYAVSQISKCLKLMMSNREGATLFHCTAGKDRTGVISALLLTMLGVPYETVLADYMKTNEVSGKNSKKYSFLARVFMRDKAIAEKVYRVFRAEKEYLDSFFQTADKNFGSFENFVSEGLKITPEEIEDFKSFILD